MGPKDEKKKTADEEEFEGMSGIYFDEDGVAHPELARVGKGGKRAKRRRERDKNAKRQKNRNDRK